ncbi:MAG: hypothetical protein QOF27_1474 [Gaiellaceae bacterium]|jgi:hypothetical protein|nr:hypothetical protein [Gaiellaceae bacterium]
MQHGHGLSLAGTLPTLFVITRGASIGWGVVLVLVVASEYEAAVALGWIAMGSQPGDRPAGEVVVYVAALASLLVGILATMFSRRILRRWPALLLPLAAAAYMTFHYYAFDPYYLPAKRRFSAGGLVPATWLYAVVVAAVIAAVVIRRRPSVAPVLTPLVLLVCALTVLGEGAGH